MRLACYPLRGPGGSPTVLGVYLGNGPTPEMANTNGLLPFPFAGYDAQTGGERRLTNTNPASPMTTQPAAVTYMAANVPTCRM
jgi:hypothetical protein